MAARAVLFGVFLTVMAGVAVTAEMIFSIAMLSMGWPYWRITALSCLLVMCPIGAVIVLARQPAPSPHQLKWVVLLGVFSAIYWGLAIVAAQIGVDAGDVATLTSVNIVVAAIMGRIFLHEPFRLLHFFSVVLSIVGAVLVARPAFIFGSSTSNRAPWYGYVFAILSGFLQGCFFICSRKAGDISAGHPALSALFFSACLTVLLPFAPVVQEAALRVALNSPLEALGWTGVAFLTTMGSAWFSCAGSMLCPAAISATVYTASTMFFGYVAQTVFFGSSPEFVTVLGAGLMLVAVALMACAGRTTSTVSDSVSEKSEVHSEVDAKSTSVDGEDDTESLSSFVASEFSDFDAKLDPLRFRGHLNHVVPPEPVGVSA